MPGELAQPHARGVARLVGDRQRQLVQARARGRPQRRFGDAHGRADRCARAVGEALFGKAQRDRLGSVHERARGHDHATGGAVVAHLHADLDGGGLDGGDVGAGSANTDDGTGRERRLDGRVRQLARADRAHVDLAVQTAPIEPGAVLVEEVPWSDGKHQLTKAYMLFLARWARKLSWKETAEAFHTSWEQVCFAVEYVVGWGLEHRTLEPIRAIGVDEIQYAKGHKYLTLVYQIDQGIIRLLWVGRERTIASFQGLFAIIGEQLAAQIEF